ncbi:MAG: hypothetical protein JNJ59_05275 [Deltaproteobacteria bacterium]|nr:hypothetical protein [Deltaproteobacteria bacterium]
MRISQSLIANISRQSTNRSANALVEAQRPILEGTSLPNDSTDLARAQRVHSLDGFDAELDRLTGARNTVRTDLKSSEESLASIHDIVVQARDLALQMGSDNIGSNVRKDAAQNAQRLMEQITAIANRRDTGGAYLFTGTAEGQPPLDGNNRYQGNDGIRKVEVGPGVKVAATVSGHDVFGANDELMTTLGNLVTALTNDDAASVRATLDDLETSRQRVSTVWSDVGGRLSTLDSLDDLTLSLRTRTQTERGELVGVDIAAAAPAIQSAQTMLEAVISTSQQLMASIGKGWFGS